MTDLSHFTHRAGDWREQIRLNQRRTRRVILTFILLYLTLGFFCDLLIYSNEYPLATVNIITQAVLTLRLIPYCTLIMSGVAAIAIFIAYSFYDRIMLLGTTHREITPESAYTLEERQLYHVIEEMKVAAGLQYMPRVFIIEANYMNAFASGYSEKSAMVTITSGLLEKLDRSELQAVMAHELSHIRHLDIKLTLMVAVLTNIMLIVIDVLFYNLVYGRRRRNGGDNRLFIIIVLLRYVLPFITMLLMFYLSRTREYMADAGCVELMRDNEPLARALLKIHQDHQSNTEKYQAEYGKTPHEDVRRAAYLYDPVKAGVEPVKGFSSWFTTHPNLVDRLKAIGYQTHDDNDATF